MIVTFIACEAQTDVQVNAAIDIIRTIKKCNVNIACNTGLEELILTEAKNHKCFITGFIPWNTFNPSVQASCNRIFSYQTCTNEKRLAAQEMVEVCHTNYNSLTVGAKKMLSRLYLAIEEADEVYVFPCLPRGGGSGLAIEIAKKLGKKLVVVKRDGEVSNG